MLIIIVLILVLILLTDPIYGDIPKCEWNSYPSAPGRHADCDDRFNGDSHQCGVNTERTDDWCWDVIETNEICCSKHGDFNNDCCQPIVNDTVIISTTVIIDDPGPDPITIAAIVISTLLFIICVCYYIRYYYNTKITDNTNNTKITDNTNNTNIEPSAPPEPTVAAKMNDASNIVIVEATIIGAEHNDNSTPYIDAQPINDIEMAIPNTK